MTKYNKLWVAIAMMTGNFIRDYWNIDLGIDEAMATGIVGGVTSALVYLVPNK